MIKPSVRTPGWSSVLLVLVSTGLLSACSRVPVFAPSSNGEAQTTDQIDKTLQSFESIPGTPYLVAHITQGEWGKSRSFSSDSYSRGRGSIHNLVFLDSGSLKSHRLFDTNQYTILEAKQVTLNSQEPQLEVKKIEKTAYFVYQVLKKDTNENKYLDERDQRTIGISDAFGKQYVEVLTDISRLLNLQALSGDRLLVIYIKSGIKTASVIDLNQRKVVATNAIANLGPDIK